jgi:hypothetical protein
MSDTSANPLDARERGGDGVRFVRCLVCGQPLFGEDSQRSGAGPGVP